MTTPLVAVRGWLAARPPGQKLWLAYSGGRDSSVLLHALITLLPEFPTLSLTAVHIHHGLNPAADAWEQHCAAQCAAYGVPLRVVRLALGAVRGNIEARARSARYAALAALMGPEDTLLCAHHQDDQAETVLLRLLRGSGSLGLSAMAKMRPMSFGFLHRPLLSLSAAQIATYAAEQGVAFVEDDSNLRADFDRNFLRLEVLPRLAQRWPAVQPLLARSARLLSEEAGLLAELAELDGNALRRAEGWALDIAGMQRLSPPRQRNLLRHWFLTLNWSAPGETVLRRVLTEVMPARADAEPCVALAEGDVRRYRGALYAVATLPDFARAERQSWDLTTPLTLCSGLGVWQASPAFGPSLRRPAPSEVVSVAYRQGGERFWPSGRAKSQCLKKLLQEAAIPPWRRERLPLLYYGEQLVAVAGLGTARDALTESDGYQLMLSPAAPDVVRRTQNEPGTPEYPI